MEAMKDRRPGPGHPEAGTIHNQPPPFSEDPGPQSLTASLPLLRRRERDVTGAALREVTAEMPGRRSCTLPWLLQGTDSYVLLPSHPPGP